MTKIPKSTKGRAEFWNVDLRTMQRWIEQGRPVHDAAKMLEWYVGLSAESQRKLSPGFVERLREVTATPPPAAAPVGSVVAGVTKPGGMGDQTVIAVLKQRFEHYLVKESECEGRGDKAGVAEATRQIKELGSIIHDMELRAQKLGKDLGDLVPRKSMEDAARFMGYHLLRCADEVIEQIGAALIQRDPTAVKLSAEEVRAVLEPIVLSAYVVQPIIRASEGDNQATPPDWLVAALKSGMEEVVEA